MTTKPIRAIVISSDYQSALLVTNKLREITRKRHIDVEVEMVLCIPDGRPVDIQPDFSGYDLLVTDNTILRYDPIKGLQVIDRLNLARYAIPQRVKHQFWLRQNNPLGVGEAERVAKLALKRVLKYDV